MLNGELISWIKCMIIAIILALFVGNVLIINCNIPSASMENTIMTHDRLIALRTSYWFHDPKRGDIVVFKFPDNPKELYIKRVIGLPGDIINIIDGKVYINNSKKPLEEDYIKEEMHGSFGPYTVPKDSYFMLGDNRNQSTDSRFWINTYVKRDAILGKAQLEYFPKIHLI